MTDVTSIPDMSVLLTGPIKLKESKDWRNLLLGPDQALHLWIKQLVDGRDKEILLAIYESDLFLHQFLAATAPMHGPQSNGLGHPFRRAEPARISAIRALAAAGLAILCPAEVEYREALSRWTEHAFPVARTNDATVPPLHGSVPAPLRRLVESISGPASHTVTAMLLDLSGNAAEERDRVVISVLLKTGSQGLAAKLKVALRPDLPHRLIPDPARMSLSTVDHDFQDSMDAAWTQAGADRLASGVTWSVEGVDGTPVPRLEDRSLGLACALVLTELVRRRQRLRSLLRWRLFQPRTTAIGQIEGNHVQGVDGYREKLQEADPAFPTLVPASDLKKTHDVPHQADIVPVSTVSQALRLSRRRDRMMLVRTLGAFATVLLVLTLGATYQVVEASRESRNTRLESLAARVAEAARRSRGADGQDLLLAMASDDIAALTDRRTTVFDDLSQDRGSLAKIFRSATGAFRDATLSGSGNLAVITGDAGTIRLIDTASREILWSTDLPPGLTFAPGQVYATASAVSDGGIAAIGLSNGRILLVRKTKGRWAEVPEPIVPGTGKGGLSGSPAVTGMAIDRDGKHLYTTGDDGIRQLSLDGRQPVHKCAAMKDIQSIEVTGGDLVLTLADRVVLVSFPRCTVRTVVRAPAGVLLHGSAIVPTKKRVAAGTIGTRLVTVDAQGVRSTIAENGPYKTAYVSDSQVAAVDQRTGDTILWDLDDGRQVFRAGASGEIRTGGRHLIWLHDGLAELHSAELDTFLTLRLIDDYRARFARWAGPHLLVGGYSQVYVLRSAATKPFLTGQLDLPAPENSLVEAIAADDTGSWGAATFRDSKTNLMRLSVWNLNDLREVTVSSAADDNPLSVEFADDRLYVGYRSGWLRVFRLSNGAWVPHTQGRLTGPVLDLAAAPNDRTVAVLASRSAGDAPTATVLDADTLSRKTERKLIGPAGLGHVTVLRDGRIVAAYGAGSIVFLQPDLTEIRSFRRPEAVYVTALAEVPGRSEVIVGARFRSLVYDTTTYANVSADRWGHAGAAADLDTSSSNGLLATVRGDGYAAQIAIWSMAPGVRRANACAAIGRNLTPEEWAEFVGPALGYRHVC